MAGYLWLFWTYSFFGYLLEKAFARLTHAPMQVRKCFRLLPLCPVYGLGVLAVLALPADWTDSFFRLALFGGLTATAVEYAVHWLYDRWFRVRFWDYSALWGNLHGRVCLVFSAVWGLLLAIALPPLQTVLTPLFRTIPPFWTALAFSLFLLDAVVSAQLLLRTEDVDALRLLPENENEP